MTLKPADYILPPCGCPECVQAGVTDKERRRDPMTGEILHGQRLRRWYQAAADFKARARAAVGPKGRHGQGFEKLVKS